MQNQHLKGKSVLILGLGSYPYGSGMGAALYCYRQGASLVVSDKKPRSWFTEQLKRLPTTKRVSVHFGSQPLSLLNGIDIVVRNPGVPLSAPILKAAKKKKIPIESDISLFLQEVRPKRVIGVTGTRGKSTVVTMIHDMLKRSKKTALLVGNIQRSPLFELRNVTKDTWIVMELSSWQVDGVQHLQWSPKIAVLTNVYPDHLNTYPSLTAYTNAKAALVQYQRKGDAAILNRDHPVTRRIGKAVPGRRYWVSQRIFPEVNGAFLRASHMVFRTGGAEQVGADLSHAGLLGKHNQINYLLAAQAARLAGATRSAIQRTVNTLKPLPGRLETLRTVNGITIVNDGISTTPEATIAALQSVLGPIALIVGGADKKLVFKQLGRAIARDADHVILLNGSATPKIAAALPAMARRSARRAATLRQAVRLAMNSLDREGTVLFSPGAASFGMFRNVDDRIDRFTDLVRRLR